MALSMRQVSGGHVVVEGSRLQRTRKVIIRFGMAELTRPLQAWRNLDINLTGPNLSAGYSVWVIDATCL